MAETDSRLEYVELVTVYIPRSYEEYVVAVPILDEHGVRHLDKNATLYRGATAGALAGYNPVIGPIEVQVSKEDYEVARMLLEDVLKTIREE